MSKRKERKKKADEKREKIKGIIRSKLHNDMIKRMNRGFSQKAAARDAFAEANKEINRMIKQHPKDAHLIRQSAFMLKRDIEAELKKSC